MENINQVLNPQPIQPVEPIKNKNVFKYLFIISLVVILGIIIAFYFVLNNKITKLSEEKPTEVTNQITVEPTAIPTIEKISINPTSTEVDQVKELTILINPTNEPNFTVSVSKIIGNYATGGAGSADSSGYGWIAVKVNGVWKKVAQGQDAVACSIVTQYQIPKEIYGACQ